MKCEQYRNIKEGHDSNVFTLSMTSHSGTHVDAPRHIDPAGLRITDFSISEFIFDRPRCIDLALSDAQLIQPEDLKPHCEIITSCDLLLIRTYYFRYRKTDPGRYWKKSPGFSVAAAHYLRETFKDLRAIGMDLPSVVCISKKNETKRSHHELLCGKNRRFLVIEDMLLDADLSRLKQVVVSPMLVEGSDSAPCTIIGVSN